MNGRPDLLLRAAEDELQDLRGLKSLIAAWVNNPTHDRDARIALAELIGIPTPAPERNP